MTTRRAVVAGLAVSGVGALLAPLRASAEAHYPSQPIRVIVPFAPGGGADLTARLLSQHVPDMLGQPLVVENRPGAAGRVGTGVIAKSAPDGYSLLVTTESSLVIAPHIGVAIGYDPLKDFAPVSLLTRNTVVLVVHPSVPAQTLGEYIALAKAHPGDMFFGSSGVGGPNHLAGETFNRMAGVKVTHVPYPGTGLAIQAVIANQVGAMWGFMAGVVPYIRNGSLRALAVGSKERSPVLPDVPTVIEAGVPGFEAVSWVGMVAPAGTPDPIVQALQQASNRALHLPEVVAVLDKSGTEIVASKPDEFARVMRDDFVKYEKLSDLFGGK